MLDAMQASSKPFVYTSGIWVLGDTGGHIADETTPLHPIAPVEWRPGVEQLVLQASQRGVRTVVIRPAVVDGRGGGIRPEVGEVGREAVG